MKYGAIFSFLVLLSAAAFAQQNSASNVDGLRYNFGYIIGYNSASYRIEKEPTFRNEDSLQSINSSGVSGFNLGLISNLKLTRHLDLRFTPTLAFTVRELNYKYINPSLDIDKQVESTYIDMPLSLKLKSIRLRNVRFFVIGGIKPAYDVTPAKRFDDTALDDVDKKVKVTRFNSSWEFGFGFDLYYQYFKMSPEIKFSKGMANLLLKENNRFSRPLSGLFTEVFQVNICLE